MRIERAVVGWDGSASAEAAVRWAAAAEDRPGGGVHIVHVLAPTDVRGPAGAVAAARAALQGVVNRVYEAHRDLTVTAEIVVGAPAEELARVAGRTAPLVVGASQRDRFRHPEARAVPVAIAGRGEGITAVVPVHPPTGRSGVVAVVRGRERSSGALTFAARAARTLGAPLTLLRITDPFEPMDAEAPVTLAAELRTLEGEFPDVPARLDPRWVRSPISLLSHSDHAALLVLEGGRPTAGPPRYSLERWLAGQARAPFVVVAEPTLQEPEPWTSSREGLQLVG